MIVNEISLVIQNKNDIRKLMADKKTKERSSRITKLFPAVTILEWTEKELDY